MFVAQTFLPLLLQSGRGYSAVAVGVLISLGTIAGAALAGLVAQLGFGPSFAPEQAVTALIPKQIALLERGVAFTLGSPSRLGSSRSPSRRG